MKPLTSFALLLVLSSCSANGQEFDPKRIKVHIETLSSDKMNGRGTGTTGELEAAAYIEAQFKTLSLQPKGDNNSFRQSFPFNSGPHGQGESGTANNIIAFLDNGAKNTIVIGAHYDHLGNSGQGSSLDANPSNKIHNGADDNASGVSGVIELARLYATNNLTESKNFLFVCFSGEELGLLGSKYLMEHSPIDIGSIDFMINMDMIGRLDEQTKAITIHGTGTSPVWEPWIKKLKTDLTITTDSSGTGPSDHTSFYLKNIPALHFFTGSHSDYHKPSDDADKVNVAGEVKVLDLIRQIISEADDEPKLAFLPTKNKLQTTRSSFKVTLGIMPSYGSDVKGLKVDGVTEGKPAAIAGIKTGDIILQLGSYEIKDIYGYMDVLGKFEKGQTIPVKLKRGEEELNVTLTF
jgi:hypothetical protein